ncbi:TrlF family AAA-like ATPase [uncultured Methanolobus sp.]|uniref:TrlF family AAA-like ATPase n=1 Tax=uncultured Methanolobus sp. TaxID=218300 RepID=UPI002AAAF0AC|nr:AAA family ATPase [uncultured Methanolobus sp.]
MLYDQCLNFLGINPSDEFEKSTAETERISQNVVHDLVHLHKKLDDFQYSRGRYIVLPHVGRNGQDSILRRGFHEHYIKMPCVGGYVDKDISDESGYQNKINGGDVNYGNKSIAVISTSDNRFEDGRELGQYGSWIKWAKPTAEAIRQACLAKESRISQTNPELPQIYIKSIDVTNSKFLGSFNINLNKQYNALIGGRGTGKSTILEYLRWGLCDQPILDADYNELSAIENKRNSLIQNTLIDVNGEVRITVVKNGILHVVKRNSGSREIHLKIGEDDFQQVKEEDIRKLLPIQSYSQKQLSDVGIKTEELKRFIEQPIVSQLDAFNFQLNETNKKLKSSYNQLIRKKEIGLEISNLNLESQSVNTQINNIRKSLTGLSDAEQITIDQKSKYETEQIIIKKSMSELDVVKTKVNDLLLLLELYPEPVDKIDETENKQLIQNIAEEFDSKFVEIKTVSAALKNLFTPENLEKLTALLEEWKLKKKSFEDAYEIAMEKSQSSQQHLQEVKNIESRIGEINDVISNRQLLLKEIGDPGTDFSNHKQKWKEIHAEKALLLNEQATKFTDLSRDSIKAEVTNSINLQPFKKQLKNILEGSRFREERIDAIIEHIKDSSEPIKEYLSILEELRLLAEVKVSDENTLTIPETPILTSCGYNEGHKTKLCNQISTDSWLSLFANELHFNPKFYYITNNELGDIIPFAEASAGQQATSLLTVLLNQTGIPLLIDQPEDDIDNRAIGKIIENIWDAKKKRQLVFTSHNANLVVNGDAELVVCCDYKDSTNQTRGILREEGAIDQEAVRTQITSVMEGGEKAFRLRKDKYGF